MTGSPEERKCAVAAEVRAVLVGIEALHARLCGPERLPRTVLDRTGSLAGTVTGRTWPCQLEGCPGRRIEVKWPDGTTTRPCSKGMRALDEETWQII